MELYCRHSLALDFTRNIAFALPLLRDSIDVLQEIQSLNGQRKMADNEGGHFKLS